MAKSTTGSVNYCWHRILIDTGIYNLPCGEQGQSQRGAQWLDPDTKETILTNERPTILPTQTHHTRYFWELVAGCMPMTILFIVEIGNYYWNRKLFLTGCMPMTTLHCASTSWNVTFLYTHKRTHTQTHTNTQTRTICTHIHTQHTCRHVSLEHNACANLVP